MHLPVSPYELVTNNRFRSVRLNLPFCSQAVHLAHTGYDNFGPKSCVVTAAPIYTRMTAAGVHSAKKAPGLTML